MQPSPRSWPGLLPRAASACLAAALACAGCSPTGSPAAGGAAGGAPLTSGPTSITLLNKMVDAPFETLYQGVRRYEVHPSSGGVLEYRERVSADGTGQFAVQTLDVLQPVLTQPEQDLFLFEQAEREGLVYRYRDLRVRDVASFLDNYLAIDSGITTHVAGRPCAHLTVRLKQGADRRVIMDVDTASGLVLRAQEETLAAVPISLLEYESIDFAPDLSNVVFHQSSINESHYPPGATAAIAQLGFVPNEPKALPSGWRQIEYAAVVLQADGRAWAKFVYTDGLGLKFFMQARPEAPSFHVSTGSDLPLEPDSVLVFEMGSWTMAVGRVHSRDVISMSQGDAAQALDLIQSSL